MPCIVCGQTSLGFAATACPYYALVHCASCDHFFVRRETDDAKSNETVQLRHFNEEFTNRGGFFVDFYERQNCRRVSRSLSLPSPGRVLEIGPGSGRLMAHFHERNHEVIGLDVSPAVAAAIKSRYGFRVERESVEEHLQRGGPARYDVIAICHTLEHVPDPLASLKAMRHLLKPGGRIYIAVPNMDSWHSRWSGWTGYERYHFHYFTRASLNAVVAKAGFFLLEDHSYEGPSGWPNTIYRTFFRRREKSAAPSSEQGGGRPRRATLEALRLAVGLAISPVRWIQGMLGRGEELVVVAGRQVE